MMEKATDSIRACHRRENVQQLECSAALDAHSPDMVLCSWMPFGVDWTSDMRACPTVRTAPQPSSLLLSEDQAVFASVKEPPSPVPQVREYVLIGEAEGGICGKQGTTWGSHWHPRLPDTLRSSLQPGGGCRCKDVSGEQVWGGNDAGVYEGFVGVDLPALSSLQLCGSDERWQSSTNSRTVSFRRHT